MASVVRGLRLDDDLLGRVKHVAEAERRPFSNAALWLIELGLEVYEKSRQDDSK